MESNFCVGFFVFLGPGVRDNRGVIGKSVSAQCVDRRVDRRDSGWAPSILTSMRVTDCVYVSDGGSIRVTDCVYDKNGPVGSGGECITTFDQEK